MSKLNSAIGLVAATAFAASASMPLAAGAGTLEQERKSYGFLYGRTDITSVELTGEHRKCLAKGGVYVRNPRSGVTFATREWKKGTIGMGAMIGREGQDAYSLNEQETKVAHACVGQPDVPGLTRR
jgi:hypothetical protein